MAMKTVATAAVLTYLSAKWRLPVDFEVIRVYTDLMSRWKKREKQDRTNAFYLAEENAMNPAIADQTFLLYESKRWTFRQFYDQALRYAGWLHSKYTIVPGEVVAINFMNSPEMLLLTMALWSLGAIPALINYNLSGETLKHSIQTSTAGLLIVEPEVATKVLTPPTESKLMSLPARDGWPCFEIVHLNDELRTTIEHHDTFRAPDSARSGTVARVPAALIATSGTTGLPKQAIVAQSKFVGGGMAASNHCGIRPVTARGPDTFYTAMPLYHGTAFIGGFGLSLTTASTLAIGRKFSVSNFWPDVRRHGVTVIQYVGETLRYLLAAPAQAAVDKNHKVRLAYGNGLRPDVWKRFKARFGIETIVEFYAATEGTFATFNPNRNEFSDGAVGQTGKLGRRLLSRSLAIVKLDWERQEPVRDVNTGFCITVQPGQPGEMLSKIDANDPHALFTGYYNNQKATQEKIMRSVFVKGDAWVRTGDVLRWDREGRIWFSDRMGDTFRWKSENVSTTEVGESIGRHPEVLEANVYGVSVPGHEGRAGCAALLLRPSALEESEGGTTVKPEVLRSLSSHARESLQRAAVPVFLRVVSEMTATGNNKTLKHVLRNQGVNLQAIGNAGGGDQIYWLRPGAETYIKFEPKDWIALETAAARL